MEWFNQERLKCADLTFPVETLNLLHDGTNYMDKEWFDYGTKMYEKGHSFFTYISDSVDSLASCCFDGKQKCLSKSSNGVNFMSFEELYNGDADELRKNFTVFHNGSWTQGKIVRLPAKPLYKIVTSNKKEVVATEDHIFPTLKGDKQTKDLTQDDYLMVNCRALDTFPERDIGLSYEQGYLVGMYIGDGSCSHKTETHTPTIHLSLNEFKYNKSLNSVEKAIKKIDEDAVFRLGKPYNNVFPTSIRSWNVFNFIKEYVSGDYCYEKELNLDCLLQSYEFRRGILDGFYVTDGGNSNRIYTSSKKLAEQIECLITSLGMSSVIDCSDRTNESVVIRGKEYARNHPLYCIRWYNPMNKRQSKDLYKVVNNSQYFKIASIEPYKSEDDYVYCFEMSNQDEPYFTLPNGIITHNCRLKNQIQKNTFSYTLGAGGIATGSKGVITININRLVQNAARDKINIEDAIRNQIKKTHKYLLAYNEIIKDYFNARMLPIYDAGFIKLSGQYLTIGINGFIEGAEFLGVEVSPNEDYFRYGEMILKPIFEENQKARADDVMFNTEFVPKCVGTVRHNP